MRPTDDERSYMTAVTYAEAGEWETARRYVPLPGKGRLSGWIERQLVAAALAEEGLHEEALTLGEAEPAPRNEHALDVLLAAHGVRMLCGVLSPAALSARR